MSITVKEDFCVECRNIEPYTLIRKPVQKIIRDRQYDFVITTAICQNCGSEMSIPGLINYNSQEIDKQYRTAEGIVSVEDIANLLKVYNIGKAPLSLALGFGEITITRYLSGQVPSKEYSDVMRRALSSPAFMKKMLNKNKDRIASSAYKKGIRAAESMEKAFSLSDKLLGVISFTFSTMEEVTPLALQKLLYFIQGIYSALNGSYIFSETCEAWEHGPVYRSVYNLFRDFSYNPIEDARFSILRSKEALLDQDERHAADLVLQTFGLYSGKALEHIIHKEEPWIMARKGYEPFEPSQVMIPNDSIKRYFSSVNEKYGISSTEGLNAYIADMLR